MKILYFIDKPNMYGSERHLLDIINYFSLQGRGDIELVAFSKGPMFKYVKVKKTIFQLGWLFSFVTLYHLILYVKAMAPDVIHCHQPKALFWGTLLGRFLNIPTIITVHSKAYDHSIIHKNIIRRLMVLVFHKFVFFISVLCAKKVIYVNEAMFESAFRKGKSVYISNWLSNEYNFGKEKSLIINKDKKIKFVSVGSVTKAKGYDLLLDFFCYLDQNNIDYCSTVYGGLDETFYEELKKHSHFSEKIKFIGYGESLIGAFNDADFYVLFSRSETFGLSYLEAMSQGLPIISLNLDELKNLIPSGNVLAKDPEIACKLFFQMLKPEIYNVISNKNIARSKQYSYISRMTELESIYQEFVKIDIE